MQYLPLGTTGQQSSRLIYGCMRLVGDQHDDALAHGKLAIRAAIDAGYQHFDLADIYGNGACESLFGETLAELSEQNPNLRDQLFLTSKAGIRLFDQNQPEQPTRYDFSSEYLLHSVDGILDRLGTEYLDMFLLHRPDFLMDALVVSDVFNELQQQGKVRYFGVSNFSASQVELLQSKCSMPLHVNQVEINIHNISSLTNGVLDQCQQRQMTPIAWCPLAAVAYPAWGNTFDGKTERRIEHELSRQAERYQCEIWHIALAWLLKHPANICPIVGSTNVERIHSAKQALTLNYSREDWYRLLEARNGKPVP